MVVGEWWKTEALNPDLCRTEISTRITTGTQGWALPLRLMGGMDLMVMGAIIHGRYRSVKTAKQAVQKDAEAYTVAWQDILLMEQSSAQLAEIAQLVSLVEMRIGYHQGSHGPARCSIGGASRFKDHQRTKRIENLFQMSSEISLDFQKWIKSWCSVGDVTPGPVKMPDRTLQKLVRTYHRDASCLTDLVRLTIVLDSVGDLRTCLVAFLRKAYSSKTVGGCHGHSSRRKSSCTSTTDKSTTSRDSLNPEQDPDLSVDLESLIRGEEGQEAEVAMMKLTNIKNRMDPALTEVETGYRSLTLNVEVGWRQQEDGSQAIVPVKEWDDASRCFRKTSLAGGLSGSSSQEVRGPLICEVQLILREFFEIKSECGHRNYVNFRNTVVQ